MNNCHGLLYFPTHYLIHIYQAMKEYVENHPEKGVEGGEGFMSATMTQCIQLRDEAKAEFERRPDA